MEDCDEDGGEGSDPPTRSFLRRRLDEQSRQVEQAVGHKMNRLLEVIQSNGEIQTQLLELIVSKVFEEKPVDQAQQLPLKDNSLQVEVVSIRPKTIDLEKRGGSSNRSDGSDQIVEATPFDMTKVQRMIDSAMKKGPKFPKFIHPYPAYVEKFPKSIHPYPAFVYHHSLCLKSYLDGPASVRSSFLYDE
ncbi:hypothetical protein EV1_020015 [Malus domestica]